MRVERTAVVLGRAELVSRKEMSMSIAGSLLRVLSCPRLGTGTNASRDNLPRARELCLATLGSSHRVEGLRSSL